MTREELIVWHQEWSANYADTSRAARDAFMSTPSTYDREDVDHFAGLAEMHAMTARELMGVNGNASKFGETLVIYKEYK